MMKYLFILLLASVLLAGCGGQAYEYHSSNETMEGPGLLSGEDGEMYLIRAKKKATDSEDEAVTDEDDGSDSKE